MKRAVMTIFFLLGLILASCGTTRKLAESATQETSQENVVEIQRKFFDRQVVLGKRLRNKTIENHYPTIERKPNLTYYYGYMYFAGAKWDLVAVVINEKGQVVKIEFEKHSDVDDQQKLYNLLKNALIEKYGPNQYESVKCIYGENWKWWSDGKTDVILDYKNGLGRDGKERYYLTLQYQDDKLIEGLRDATYEL